MPTASGFSQITLTLLRRASLEEGFPPKGTGVRVPRLVASGVRVCDSAGGVYFIYLQYAVYQEGGKNQIVCRIYTINLPGIHLIGCA